MEILTLITEQENKAAELKAEAVQQARDKASEYERETDLKVKEIASAAREKRAQMLANAEADAAKAAKELIEKSEQADKQSVQNACELIDSVSAAIVKEVAGV